MAEDTPTTDDDGGRPGAFDHLFTPAVRDGLGEAGYGSWRAIDAPDAVSLSFGFPFPESFPNDELAAAAEAVFEAEGGAAMQYGGGEYADRLAEAIAERERDRGIDCDAGNVLLTNGATHAIDVVAHAFLDRGDHVFVEAPTFMGTLKLFANYGVEVAGFETDDEGLDVGAVAAELESRTAEGRPLPKLLYTIPTFQNPTGTTLSRDRRERLLDLAEEYDFVVVEDDAYGDLRYGGDDVAPLKALDETGRVVRVGTFSKTVAPGVRTGWILGDDEPLDTVGRIRAGGTNTFTQSVLGYYCTEGGFEGNVAELRAAYEKRRDHILACLDDHMPEAAEWTDPDGGFFVWVELPEGIDAEELLPRAADEGVTYLPGEMFFPDDRGENGLRLSFSYVSLDEMERGIEALARATRSALRERRPR
ncbi:PLP-dependent aminotransferase family protein [Halorussus salilacus]|uniref:aminotransferase-like domain-containing protein n=1 Tax=Halorussus salilacus TaxID=2953750 RepID=UPI0020A050BE|nr:PLP-dependent aminotransferase family protein [Halorussus salilacus]USZ67373.1 PLP-dependent aminotransferase family protein [Halorussus salilacus]